MIRVLVEGISDVPTITEIFVRGFGYVQGSDFQVYRHRGKGDLPINPAAKPAVTEQTLLGQLPAKLRAYGRSDKKSPVIVLLDADRDNPTKLAWQIYRTVVHTTPRPDKVFVRVAVEEIESWFIADTNAVRLAYPQANITSLLTIAPDAVVGAWEALARALGRNPEECTGADKEYWAKEISPHLTLNNPTSPSFRRLISMLERLIGVPI